MTKVVRLGDVVEVVGGGTPKRSNPNYFGGGIPWVTPKDMKTWIVKDSMVTLTEAGLDAGAAKIVPANSILIVVRSGVLKHTIPVAINSIPVSLNQDMKAMICSTAVEPAFMARFVKWRSPEILQWVRATTADNFPIERLKNLEVPLPGRKEQQRIAALLVHVDSLRARRREVLARLDHLVDAVFVDMFGDPAANPLGWDRVPFGDILRSIDSGKSPVCLDRSAEPDEWAVLKLGAVTYGRFDERQNKALPVGVTPNPEHEVREGDLLFARKNTATLVGAAALVHKVRPRLLLPDLVFRLDVPEDAANKSFLRHLLMWPSKRKQVQGLASGSAASMPNISKSRLRTLLIELPDPRRQTLFAERVADVERLRELAEMHLRRLEAGGASLEHRAFSGQL